LLDGVVGDDEPEISTRTSCAIASSSLLALGNLVLLSFTDELGFLSLTCRCALTDFRHGNFRWREGKAVGQKIQVKRDKKNVISLADCDSENELTSEWM